MYQWGLIKLKGLKDSIKWGRPLAVSGQLAKRARDVSHHLILMAVT
jgi:hypothetical protein